MLLRGKCEKVLNDFCEQLLKVLTLLKFTADAPTQVRHNSDIAVSDFFHTFADAMR